MNGTILRAADTRYTAPGNLPTTVVSEGIEAFSPMAAIYRKYLFGALARNWRSFHEQDPQRADGLLRWVDPEAAAAVRWEPWNWRIEHLLARLYRVVADTRPDHEARARSHLPRARTLARAREVFPAPLVPPGDLAAGPLPDGGLELRWLPPPGAGYHRIAQAAESDAWRTIRYAYGPAPGTLAVPGGGFRYRIRACRYPQDCSPWEEWR